MTLPPNHPEPRGADPFDALVADACAGDLGALQLVQTDCADELAAIERAHCCAFFDWRRAAVLERLWRAMRRRQLTMPSGGRGGLPWLRATFTKMAREHAEHLKAMPPVET